VGVRAAADIRVVNEGKELYPRFEGIEIPRGEFEASRARQARASRIFWVAVIAAAVGSGCVVGGLSSLAVGFLASAVITMLGYEIHRRWNRARWMKRFPELQHGGFEWKQTSAGWRIEPGASYCASPTLSQ
jgi:hypothetical protein